MYSVLTTKTWPLYPPLAPTEQQIAEKQEAVEQIDAAKLSNPQQNHKVAQLYLEYAEILRDTERFQEAETYAQKALSAVEKETEISMIAQMVLSSIYTRQGKIDEAMLIIETLIGSLSDLPNLKTLLEPLLIRRAILFYLFGHTSLATKDLDHALMLREKRTGQLDPEILDTRHHILLLEEDPETIQREHARPPVT